LSVDGTAVQLPNAGERVVAFLALQRRAVSRQRVAGTLWPNVSEEHSLGSLRSALWRLGRLAGGLVVPGDTTLALATNTKVDTDMLDTDMLDAALGPTGDDAEKYATACDPLRFGDELLADWYDDWVVFDRERIRITSLNRLEELSRRQSRAGRHAEATETAAVAISLEPLRESAHAALIDAHLAEGNLSEAVRRLRIYATILDAELKIEPGADLVGRVADALRDRACADRPRISVA